jgi:hypothetical protein
MKKKFTIQTLTLALSFLLLGNVLTAQTTVYVSPTGTSGGAGTEASPKNIGSAINNIAANQTVILLDGTYDVSASDMYIWQKIGTETQPIVIKAQNKHMAILKGATSGGAPANRYATLYVAGCKYLTVDGLTVMRDSPSTDSAVGINVASASGLRSEYITIKNCKVYNHGISGISSAGTDHITIENNIVYNNSRRSSLNGSGISIYKPRANTADNSPWGMIIRGNISYDNRCELNFYYNENGTIYQNNSPTDGNGIILDLFDNDNGGAKYGKKVLVENNLCYNNGGAGIKSYKTSLARIVNNTCYRNNQVLNRFGRSAQISVVDAAGISGVYNEGIYNNVCVAISPLTTNEDFAMIIDFDLTKVTNNHLVGRGAVHNNYNPTVTGFPSTTNGNVVRLIADQTYPKFVNPSIDPAVADFKLQNTSPLIDQYTGANGPTVDIDGIARPRGNGIDVGCYESAYTATSIRPTPVTSSSNQKLQTTLITNNTLAIVSRIGTYSAVVYNSTGAKVFAKTSITGNANINIATLTTGTYTVIIDDGKSRKSQRFVVIK